MLEFFRTYQRYFFFVITVVVIASFTFFGTYSTFGEEPERKDRMIGRVVDGSAMMLSEVQKLSRFISTDREDALQGKGLVPNFCNDGVIRYDLLKSGVADILVKEYFDGLKGDFEARLDKARRFKSYVHPEAPVLSAKAVWERLVPGLNEEVAALQAEGLATPEVFGRLSKLYQLHSRLQPEILRRILIYQHQQYPWLSIDQKLSYEDLSLFGFHSIADWFGYHFVDLMAEFILNVAAAAEEKGYKVSLEEAKGDLVYHFVEAKTDLNFHNHLRMLGFDEKSASEVWRKVLLFRRYFRDVGEAAFVDRLPYRDFAGYAQEMVVVQKYEWPLQLKNGKDLAELQFYIKAVCAKSKGALPEGFLPVEEVEKKVPALVRVNYRAKVAEVSKKEIALRPSLKEMWDWQVNDPNWARLAKQFSLPPQLNTGSDRFTALEKLEPKIRSQVDAFSRECLVDENPAWIQEALDAAPLNEKTWSVAANEEPILQSDGIYYRVEDLEKVGEKQILTFQEARTILSQLVKAPEGEYSKEKNPFVGASKEALAALQKNPLDPRWVQSSADPLIDQFKLRRKEVSIQRNSQENWMKEQAFMMLPDLWSPIHVADDGEVVFFYVQEKKANQEPPILDQLDFGKETLAADAQRYVTERLLKRVKMKNAIVIPIQKEDE